MTTIRKLINAWLFILVGSLFLFPLVNIASASGTTYVIPFLTTTIPDTITGHTTAIEAFEYGGTTYQGSTDGRPHPLFGMSLRFIASKKAPLWSSTKNKSSVENAFGHWKKHGNEFPELQNAKQYTEQAKDFLNNPPKGTLTGVYGINRQVESNRSILFNIMPLKA